MVKKAIKKTVRPAARQASAKKAAVKKAPASAAIHQAKGKERVFGNGRAPTAPKARRRIRIVNPFTAYNLHQWMRGLINLFAFAGADFIISSIVMKKCLATAQQMWGDPNHWCNRFMNFNINLLEAAMAVIFIFAGLMLVKVIVDLIIHARSR
ncbi:MAG: hypothetical protein LBH41_01100 [Rickettsiales bacterium]|jgi:hypothetical protein|nr:hypothetical protein [Rickettsiales bacterium]